VIKRCWETLLPNGAGPGTQRRSPKRRCGDHVHPSNARPAGARPKTALRGNRIAFPVPPWTATTNP
jgi:hypothetical protein